MKKERYLITLLILVGLLYMLFADVNFSILKDVFLKGTAFSVPVIILVIIVIRCNNNKLINILIFTALIILTIIIRFVIALKDYNSQGVIMLMVSEVSLACLVYLLFTNKKNNTGK